MTPNVTAAGKAGIAVMGLSSGISSAVENAVEKMTAEQAMDT